MTGAKLTRAAIIASFTLLGWTPVAKMKQRADGTRYHLKTETELLSEGGARRIFVWMSMGRFGKVNPHLRRVVRPWEALTITELRILHAAVERDAAKPKEKAL